ncbi:hypothetical protein [Thomasclavelia cocleata]|uniref:hypothetical protein n=1 Tax=Thomasclavelia cocleata TaxID=69824 RepID=UPI00242E5C63|nr:hypothetical protein [Thomasclavelia cocleata]
MTNINGYYEFGNPENDSKISYNKILKSHKKILNEQKIAAIATFNSGLQQSIATVLLTDKSLYYFKGIKYKSLDISSISTFSYDINNLTFTINGKAIKIDTTITRTDLQNLGQKISSILGLNLKEEKIIATKAPNKTANNENKEVVCSKCGSSSITTTSKKLSVKRAVIGTALLNPLAGAVGAVTSKKLYCVCMNCGHKWKL